MDVKSENQDKAIISLDELLKEYERNYNVYKDTSILNMNHEKRESDASRWYFTEMAARVVADSGRACDLYHLGKFILQGLKNAPEFTLQIDGSTGESETFGSVLERSVRCAIAFKELGLKTGDVIVIMAPNNLNLNIPLYAALYLGILVAPIDRFLKIQELKVLFVIDEPKIVFCENKRVHDVQTALGELNLDSRIVTTDVKSENQNKATSLDELLKDYGINAKVQDFKPSNFYPQESNALLMPTSGTTGLPKQVYLTHKNFMISVSRACPRFTTFPCPFKAALIVSPMQWVSAIYHFICAPIFRYTNVMSPLDIDTYHFYDLVNKYKPDIMSISPTKLATCLGPETKDKCDFSCYKVVLVAGSSVSPDLLKSFQELAPEAFIFSGYGLTETSGLGFHAAGTVHGSVGIPAKHLQYRLIDVDTQKDIFQPNTPGELWMKGPSVCKASFSEDGWFKTGDLFYRDEHDNYFFLDRIKLLMKYMNHHISPAEIQNVIQQHPAVQDVAVTSISNKCGDLPVACVVRMPGCHVTAQEIKDLVKESLTDTKQLRGGVVFMDKIPVTATTKVDYRGLKKLVLDLDRE